MSFPGSQPVGAILAGGRGRRLRGSKATAQLSGRPMISYPLAAMQEALGGAVVVAKADSRLPSLPGVEVWIEPDQPHHPLTGLVHALGRAQGGAVLVCACDLPLVPASLIEALATTDPGGTAAVIAQAEGRPQPLLGCYQPAALETLADALERRAAVTEAVAAVGAVPFEVSDPALLFNVNTREDLMQAEGLLADQPNVKS